MFTQGKLWYVCLNISQTIIFRDTFIHIVQFTQKVESLLQRVESVAKGKAMHYKEM